MKKIALTTFVIGILTALTASLCILGNQGILPTPFNLISWQCGTGILVSGCIVSIFSFLLAKQNLKSQARLPVQETPISSIPNTSQRIFSPISYSAISEEKESILEKEWQDFKKNALFLMQQKKYKKTNAQEIRLEETEKSDIRKRLFSPNLNRLSRRDFRSQSGGEQKIVQLNRFPQFVFKKPLVTTRYASEFCAQKEKIAQEADQICEKENLFLFSVPQTTHLVLGKQHAIVQEKIEVNSDYSYQEALFQRCLEDPDLKEFAFEIRRQKGILICKLKVADVKFDNFPFTQKGVTALMDLDAAGALIGLTQGATAQGSEGLFRMMPEAFFDRILPIITPLLSKEDQEELQKQIPTLREKAKEREKVRQRKIQFLQKRGIHSTSQIPELSEKDLLSFSGKEKENALKLFTIIKEELTHTTHFDLVIARSLSFEIESFLYAEEVLNKSEDQWKKLLTCIQEKGYLMDFKLSKSEGSLYLSLFC